MATTKTPTISSVTIAGSTTAGVTGVSFLIQSPDALIDGVAVPEGATFSYNATGIDTVNSISYSLTTGSILITYLT